MSSYKRRTANRLINRTTDPAALFLQCERQLQPVAAAIERPRIKPRFRAGPPRPGPSTAPCLAEPSRAAARDKLPLSRIASSGASSSSVNMFEPAE
ncbi:hypothetical protein Bphy_4106 [Paraburkholderia phymatum STM815]|uniref:Uncharacterized protein n=1 Tax=Paraburkholderia phymatum (strain DSM 17167 / CIP 108236 / LMG 21445 / STM815) TaxID=391038 RepID=B2JPN7_PARP8|nr:hypothetical protein Bphy_4106 [Paraburkholderia phymatum STM815]